MCREEKACLKGGFQVERKPNPHFASLSPSLLCVGRAVVHFCLVLHSIIKHEVLPS